MAKIIYIYDVNSGQATVDMSRETAKEISTAIEFFEIGLEASDFSISEVSKTRKLAEAIKRKFISGGKINGGNQEFVDAIKARCKELLEI